MAKKKKGQGRKVTVSESRIHGRETATATMTEASSEVVSKGLETERTVENIGEEEIVGGGSNPLKDGVPDNGLTEEYVDAGALSASNGDVAVTALSFNREKQEMISSPIKNSQSLDDEAPASKESQANISTVDAIDHKVKAGLNDTANNLDISSSTLTTDNAEVTASANDDTHSASYSYESNCDKEEVWDIKKVLSIYDITETRTQCSNPKCKTIAACIWTSNLAPTKEWFTCLDCQEADFGGFPPVNELPVPGMTQEHEEIMMQICSRKKHPKMPHFEKVATISPLPSSTKTPISKAPTMALITPAASSLNGSVEIEQDGTIDESAVPEVWELTKVLSMKEILDCPVKCSNESCTLLAACTWVSNLAPTVKWYGCLDCQSEEFGGWPPLEELPVTHMTKEHMEFLKVKCSRKKNVVMPDFATASPIPLSCPTRDYSRNSLVAVTPLPSTQDDDTADDDDVPAKGNLTTQKPQHQPSKQALAMHRKWQEAATAAGGKDARIVVSKPKAKKLIFDLLENAFRPMNISDIHKELKAMVPSPVLKASLDDMVKNDGSTNDEFTFADSDDEEDAENEKTPKKAKMSKDTAPENDPYKASLCSKTGKISNTCLYYVDYSKLKNNGNGLDSCAYNELAADLALAQAEELALTGRIKTMTAKTMQLLSEPNNEELVARLETDEYEMKDLVKKVEEGRKLKVNEKYKLNVKRCINDMTGQWRKRRQICMDFLITMEEITDGSISTKKCMSGDGPIDIDSDELIAKAAVDYAIKKRSAPQYLTNNRSIGPSKKSKLQHSLAGNEDLTSEDFVAVILNYQGFVERISVEANSTKK